MTYNWNYKVTTWPHTELRYTEAIGSFKTGLKTFLLLMQLHHICKTYCNHSNHYFIFFYCLFLKLHTTLTAPLSFFSNDVMLTFYIHTYILKSLKANSWSKGFRIKTSLTFYFSKILWESSCKFNCDIVNNNGLQWAEFLITQWAKWTSSIFNCITWGTYPSSQKDLASCCWLK